MMFTIILHILFFCCFLEIKNDAESHSNFAEKKCFLVASNIQRYRSRAKTKPKNNLFVFELPMLHRLLLNFLYFCIICYHVLLWLSRRLRQKLTWKKILCMLKNNTIANVKWLVCRSILYNSMPVQNIALYCKG